MSETDVGALIHDAMIVTMKLSLPDLGVALVVGLLISFIQAVTQINEATLAFLPKVLAIGVALMSGILHGDDPDQLHKPAGSTITGLGVGRELSSDRSGPELGSGSLC